MLITDYLTMQKKYEAQYGERTVVLMHIYIYIYIYVDQHICYCLMTNDSNLGSVSRDEIY